MGLLFSKIASGNKGIAVDSSISGYKFTFDDLDKVSNRMAHFLIESGTENGDVIAIFNKKSFFGYASMIAALKVGAAYVNLDESIPIDRLKKILLMINPKIIFSGPSKKADLDKDDFLIFENFNSNNISKLSEYPSSLPSQVKSVRGDNIAYIMFTSGSTGFPKGVPITHKSIYNFICWTKEKFEISANDRISNINPLFFDNSVFDFYASLFNQATIIPVEDRLLQEPMKLVRYLSDMNISIWFSVPSLYVYILKLRAFKETDLSNLRSFVFGGEAFPKNSLRKLADLFYDRIKFINVYGPTECTCICSFYNVQKLDIDDDSLLPLGEIAENFNYLIIENNNIVNEENKIGEMYLSGDNLAPGYYNDNHLTSQKFIQSPLHNKYVDIFYKTGDLVSVKKNKIHFAGRKDNQIKRMGYRIELEEIEFALNSIEYINESAVISVNQNESIRIIAFIQSSEADVIKVRNDLREKLPNYMLPDDCVCLEYIPKNKNGKINRKELKLLFTK